MRQVEEAAHSTVSVDAMFSRTESYSAPSRIAGETHCDSEMWSDIPGDHLKSSGMARTESKYEERKECESG